MKKEQKLQRQKDKKEEKHNKQCTFKPHIDPNSKKIASKSIKKAHEDLGTADTNDLEIRNDLYKDRKEKNLQRI